ncbi:MAG: hypothetical protein H6R42_789 [Nitrospirae bacterium]|nr:hypothetical protein [Nitrospirota bacterium]
MGKKGHGLGYGGNGNAVGHLTGQLSRATSNEEAELLEAGYRMPTIGEVGK